MTNKRVLMVAFHFPPFSGSSGLQRTLCFSRYLSAHGWDPVVLSASRGAYPEVGDDQLADIPASVPVKRAYSLDAARHFSIGGRYPQWMALPDRWSSWLLAAVPAGLRLVHKYKPRVLWSTYPIATAHLIAFALHRMTGLPWVADFRDPMTEFDPITGNRAPANPAAFHARRWVERLTVKHCDRAVFVAPGALGIYAGRYPDLPCTRWALIANGYDEEAFAVAERMSRTSSRREDRVLLLHSGHLYPTPDRDPSVFLAALATLRTSGQISSSNLKVVLRGCGHEDIYRDRICENGLEGIVSLEPIIPYREALAEMLNADGVLLFQGYTSNPAIPAKLYEYLRARRPIFAMVDSEGDTAEALRAAGVGQIVPLVSREQIAKGLLEFLGELRSGVQHGANQADIRSHSREAKTQELARVLEAVSC